MQHGETTGPEKTEEPLDLNCILAGAAVTGWKFLPTFILKPLAIALALILAAAGAVGAPVGLLMNHGGEHPGVAVSMGLVMGIIGASFLAIIGAAIWAGIMKMWELYGHNAAQACRDRKKERTAG